MKMKKQFTPVLFLKNGSAQKEEYLSGRGMSQPLNLTKEEALRFKNHPNYAILMMHRLPVGKDGKPITGSMIVDYTNTLYLNHTYEAVREGTDSSACLMVDDFVRLSKNGKTIKILDNSYNSDDEKYYKIDKRLLNALSLVVLVEFDRENDKGLKNVSIDHLTAEERNMTVNDVILSRKKAASMKSNRIFTVCVYYVFNNDPEYSNKILVMSMNTTKFYDDKNERINSLSGSSFRSINYADPSARTGNKLPGLVASAIGKYDEYFLKAIGEKNGDCVKDAVESAIDELVKSKK